MKKGLVYVRKSIIVFLITSLVLSLVFFAVAKPKTVKAEPITVGLTLGAVVMAFLAASGVAISSSGIDENNLDSSLSTMLSGYEKSDLTYEDWVNNIGDYDGLDWLIGRENKAGAVAIGYELMDWLSGLPSWLIGTYGLSSSGESTIVQGGFHIQIGNVNYPVYNMSAYNTTLFSVSIDSGQLKNYSIFDVSLLNTPQTLSFSNDTYITFTNTSNSQYGQRMYYNLVVYVNGVKTVDRSSWISGLITQYKIEDQVCCLLTNYQNNICFSFGYRLNNTLSSDIGCNSAISLIGNQDITESGGLTGTIDDEYYQDFQDAVLPDINAQTGNDDAVGVIDLGAGVAEGAITQEQLIQNILDAVYANELEGTWTGVYEDQKTAEEDSNAESVPSEAELGSNIVVIDGLEDFFPFCIPFDLIAIFNIFDAEPVTPHWEPEISFGGIFQAETIVIDFTNFETVAIIVRAIIIVAFCIFLILKTRDLIRG